MLTDDFRRRRNIDRRSVWYKHRRVTNHVSVVSWSGDRRIVGQLVRGQEKIKSKNTQGGLNEPPYFM